MNRSLGIGLTCLALSTAGWLAVLLTVLIEPEGHPPTSAYVALSVIVASIPISLAGIVASGWSVRRRAEHAVLRTGSAIGNGIFLAVAAYHLTRF